MGKGNTCSLPPFMYHFHSIHSESDLFNKLESVALSTQPITPVLGCAISRALGTRNSVSGQQ